MIAIAPLHASAQQSSREQLRVYNQQSRPIDRGERDWGAYRNYDYNRYEDGQRGYYANRYYRDNRSYRAVSMTVADRLYRGSDHKYYCRRTDGTTGLVEGLSGNVRGDVLTLGGSDLVGTILATRNGASLGKAVDRGKLICR